jgi:magnesium chelatase family protein
MGHVQRDQQRISGPMFDRIDLHIEMARVPFQKLASLESGEASATIRARVETARKVQEARFRKWGKPGVLVNGDMGPAGALQYRPRAIG